MVERLHGAGGHIGAARAQWLEESRDRDAIRRAFTSAILRGWGSVAQSVCAEKTGSPPEITSTGFTNVASDRLVHRPSRGAR